MGASPVMCRRPDFPPWPAGSRPPYTWPAMCRRRHRLLSDVAAALLLAALLLRGLTPPGYMPGSGPAGLKLCTSIGLVDAAGSGPGQDGAAGDPDPGHDLCPFAAAASAAPGTQSVDLVSPATEVRWVQPTVFARSAVPADAIAPWPRGPPFLR
jgi:hypothetical protein